MDLKISSYGKEFTLQEKWTEKLVEVFKQENIESLVLNSSRGFREENLDFLSQVNWLRKLVVLDQAIRDISGVHVLKSLQSIYMDDYSGQAIDFTNFPEMQECRMQFAKNRSSISACRKLRLLRVQHYPYKTLAPLSNLLHLETLRITMGSLGDISDITRFTKLRELGLILLRNVKDISALASLKSLQILSLQNCKGVETLEAISELTEMRDLNIWRCGAIDSLRPLANFKKLERLDVGTTIIRDGDLKVLLGLPSLRFLTIGNRKEYNIKREEIPMWSKQGSQPPMPGGMTKEEAAEYRAMLVRDFGGQMG